MNEHRHDDERARDDDEDANFRIEVRPPRPPQFTIRATVLSGRMIIGEVREEYATMYGAMRGLRDLGLKLSENVIGDWLQQITPETEFVENRPSAP